MSRSPLPNRCSQKPEMRCSSRPSRRRRRQTAARRASTRMRGAHHQLPARPRRRPCCRASRRRSGSAAGRRAQSERRGIHRPQASTVDRASRMVTADGPVGGSAGPRMHGARSDAVMSSLVAAGPITWQLAMSSPFSEPMPASRGLSAPVAQPLPGADMPAPGLAISGVSRTYQTDDGPVAALGPVDLRRATGPLRDPHRAERLR